MMVWLQINSHQTSKWVILQVYVNKRKAFFDRIHMKPICEWLIQMGPGSQCIVQATEVCYLCGRNCLLDLIYIFSLILNHIMARKLCFVAKNFDPPFLFLLTRMCLQKLLFALVQVLLAWIKIVSLKVLMRQTCWPFFFIKQLSLFLFFFLIVLL